MPANQSGPLHDAEHVGQGGAGRRRNHPQRPPHRPRRINSAAARSRQFQLRSASRRWRASRRSSRLPTRLLADNVRYAYAAGSRSLRGVVISPDPEVRDDLARVLRAVDPGSLVVAGTADQLTPAAIAKALGAASAAGYRHHSRLPRQAVSAPPRSCSSFRPAAGKSRSSPRSRSARWMIAPICGPLTRPLLLGSHPRPGPARMDGPGRPRHRAASCWRIAIGGFRRQRARTGGSDRL